MDEFDKKDELELIRSSTLETPIISLFSIISGWVCLKINVFLAAIFFSPAVIIFFGGILDSAINIWRRIRWSGRGNRISAAKLVEMVMADKIVKVKINYYGGFDAARLTPSAVALDAHGMIYRVPFMWFGSIEKIGKTRPDLLDK